MKYNDGGTLCYDTDTFCLIGVNRYLGSATHAAIVCGQVPSGSSH